MHNGSRKIFRLEVLALGVSILFAPVPAGIAQSQTDLQSAIQLVKENKSSQAVAALKSITSKNKQDAVAWYYLGVAYLEKPDLKKATDAFEKATSLKSDMAEAFTGLGYCYLRRGKLNVAKGATERSLSLQPVSADAHYTLGIINLRMGDRDEALKNAEAAIKERPSMSEAYLLKAQSLVYFVSSVLVQVDDVKEERISRYRQAVTALEKYMELVPDSDDKTLWQEQLASLRAHSQLSENEVFTGKQVTTKVRLIKKPEPSYTESARQNLVTGTVVLKAVFAADGKVKYILVVASLPDGLTARAIDAARKIKFVPATKDGRTVSMYMQLEYNFNLYP